MEVLSFSSAWGLGLYYLLPPVLLARATEPHKVHGSLPNKTGSRLRPVACQTGRGHPRIPLCPEGEGSFVYLRRGSCSTARGGRRSLV